MARKGDELSSSMKFSNQDAATSDDHIETPFNKACPGLQPTNSSSLKLALAPNEGGQRQQKRRVSAFEEEVVPMHLPYEQEEIFDFEPFPLEDEIIFSSMQPVELHLGTVDGVIQPSLAAEDHFFSSIFDTALLPTTCTPIRQLKVELPAHTCMYETEDQSGKVSDSDSETSG